MKLMINCDMGEGFGRYSIGNEDEIFPYIHCCSIACGFHAGDPWHIDTTIDQAMKHGCVIGAHPSYPDLQGFGRRYMAIPAAELQSMLRYQIAALKGMVESKGARLHYVKPHGALYNTMVINKVEAAAVLEAIASIDDEMAVVGLANSLIEDVADKAGLDFWAEAFVDRRYTSEGQLLPRDHPEAIIHTIDDMLAQARSIAREGRLQTAGGQWIALEAQTLCLHGDHPQAGAFAKALHGLLGEI